MQTFQFESWKYTMYFLDNSSTVKYKIKLISYHSAAHLNYFDVPHVPFFFHCHRMKHSTTASTPLAHHITLSCFCFFCFFFGGGGGYSRVETLSKDHPIGHKNMVFLEVVFGDRFSCTEIWDLFPGVCGPSRQVVSQGSGLSRQVSLYLWCICSATLEVRASPVKFKVVFTVTWS